MNDLTHLSLFTGIGGIDLAAEWAGFRTVAQVEQDPYCQQDLAKHWPDVPRFDDVRTVTNDALRDAGIERPTLLSGGFPCQPFSLAGQRRGTEDDRFLWPEMLRIVQELRPAWVFGENVVGIISLALDDCIADLERIGYTCRPFHIPAAGVGAPHQRERVFVVAHAAGELLDGEMCARGGRTRPPDGRGDVPDTNPFRCDLRRSEGEGVYRENPARHEIDSGGGDVPDAVRPGRQELDSPTVTEGSGFDTWCSDPRGGQWAVEPSVGRVVDGVSGRVERLRALGNAVVPQQVYPILRGIAMIELGYTSHA
ncbi:DNA (cytosine-5)-methyltransferase 1 [Methanofollis sp. W23]|uniref:DNA cytosine methyltransferase n=1 Tax=Methanofollis sp. W23 TaxID=2817849 RepID=UPI001AE4EE04|nr:DNA cytosine methyltransferase [Methanofollis sp. W23]MBP2147222.1 DNA (cytosine-5)-methyltransferase 1 [Methanofollis sp. W23]